MKSDTMTLVTLVTLTNKELLKRREVVGVTAAFRRSIVFGNLIQKKGHRVTRVTGAPLGPPSGLPGGGLLDIQN